MVSEMSWQRPRASLLCLVLALCAALTSSQTTEAPEIYHDCSDLPAGSPSGVYSLRPGTAALDVPAYCDMENDGGGWTVITRRDDIEPRVDFVRDWETYKYGLGSLQGEFYWGNEYMYQLTSETDRKYQVHFWLEDFDGETRFAVYQDFLVKSEADFFFLNVGEYSGDAGDSFAYNNNHNFSTVDQDNDGHRFAHCAKDGKAGWWFSDCTNCQMTGVYYPDGMSGTAEKGITWYFWKNYEPHSLKAAVMKVKPM